MAERKRIGLREVRALGPGEIAWDAAVAGFHARRQRGPAVTYAVFYRTKDGRQRWHKIGRHGAPWTPEKAREAAVSILGSVVDGADPAAEKHAARNAKTVAELCDLYLADAVAGRLLPRRKVTKKPSTIATDSGRIERHIKPLLGRMTLGAIFTYAVRHRMRSDNPVHGVMRFADGRRERRLSDDEYAILGAALRQGEAEGIWPAAIGGARFLALT